MGTLSDLNSARAVLIIIYESAVAGHGRRQCLPDAGKVVRTLTGERQPLALASRGRA